MWYFTRIFCVQTYTQTLKFYPIIPNFDKAINILIY